MANYQEHMEQFKAIDTTVVALSVDSESDAQKMVDNNELTFPVLYGLDGIKTLETIGGYVNEKPPYLHQRLKIFFQRSSSVNAVHTCLRRVIIHHP